MKIQERGGPKDLAVEQPARTATERLAEYVVGLEFDDLPDEVVTKAKELLVHHLGLAFRGHADPYRRRAVQAAYHVSGSCGTCTVIGERRRATLLDAVFANSHLMSHLGMDDFLMPPGIHPGVLTHPVGLAVGELERSDGREYVTAVVAGYDVMTKLARALFPWNLPLPRQTWTLYGTFASAAVAARLLRLSREQTALAFAHAAHGGVGLIESGPFFSVPSQNARNGVFAAALARAGMPEVSTMIEGNHGLYRSYSGDVPEELEPSLQTLGDEFEILKARTKRYPGSGLNIVPMELARELVDAHDLRPENVSRIDVLLPQEREQREAYRESEAKEDHQGRPPSYPAGSLRFLIAGVVTTRTIDPHGFAESRNRQLEDVLDKVRLHFEADHASRFCRLEIATTRGERFAAEGDDHAFPPVPWDEWLAEGGRQLFSVSRLERLVEVIQELEHVDDMQDVTRGLVPDAGR